MHKEEKKRYKEQCRFLRLMKKIYGVLESGNWSIKYTNLEYYRGYFLYEEKLILLDPRKNILPTLIHECLHVLFYQQILKKSWFKTEEAEVQKLEKFCEKNLTPKDAERLTELLLKNLITK